MNVYDTERMTESLQSEGYVPTDSVEDADMILLNTCHIREKAAEKVYSELGRFKNLKSEKPDLKIGVVGCVAQAEGEEIIRRQPLVDLVVGPDAYKDLPNLLKVNQTPSFTPSLYLPLSKTLPSKSYLDQTLSFLSL